MIRVGPAGWSYDDWAGIVYPARRPKGFDPLGYLSAYVDTIEVNSTFYRPASPRAAEGWVRRVEDRPRFRFTAKLWRRFSHERERAFNAAEVNQARAALDALSEAGRLGAVLVQFPWSFKRDDAAIEWLDRVIDSFSDLPLVVEVRHESWEDPEYLYELAERGVGFVNIDQPRFRRSLAPSAHVTSRVAYVRVHGRNYENWWRQDAEPYERYDYLYTAVELVPWAARAQVMQRHPRTEDVYVVTNNHLGGQGVANALMLRSMIEGRPVAMPPGIVAAFPETVGPYALRDENEPTLFP